MAKTPEVVLLDWAEARKYSMLDDRIPRKDQIFVFGSNYAGLHGRGAAKFAVQHYGAVYGIAEGMQGQSYAIPTKLRWNKSLNLHAIQRHVTKFLDFARRNQQFDFYVTKVGCGLAGYTEADIIPMFEGAPLNCDLPRGWREKLSEEDDILDQIKGDRDAAGTERDPPPGYSIDPEEGG